MILKQQLRVFHQKRISKILINLIKKQGVYKVMERMELREEKERKRKRKKESLLETKE